MPEQKCKSLHEKVNNVFLTMFNGFFVIIFGFLYCVRIYNIIHESVIQMERLEYFRRIGNILTD